MQMHFANLSKDCSFSHYTRSDTDQKSYSTLEEVFQNIDRDIPFTIEVKDMDMFEASKKTIDLIRKYDRFHSTAIGSEDSSIIDQMLNYEPRLSTFFGT